MTPDRIRVIDSHTEGEPTRVVVEGFPNLMGTSMAERVEDFRKRQDHLRRAIVCEPRGHEAVVGALVTPPVNPDSNLGVIFFNDIGYLGMCGHGLIGLAATLAHTGQWTDALLTVDTPVGTVTARRSERGVEIENVPSRCTAIGVPLQVPGLGQIHGNVAYGGNWFFLVNWPEELRYADRSRLLQIAEHIRQCLRETPQDIEGWAEIDHIELCHAHENFVLCPGAAYDRSPCGTGTSAHMAAMRARGELELEETWTQVGIAGGSFVGWLELRDGELIPHLVGRAHVTAESTLILDAEDPFRFGIEAPSQRLAGPS
ncbi:MAG: 4-hydroxyproline 2-epimerase [Fimbriimonadaceae bacterium]|nr:4-hydroxyproline 2-epimerase [Fimbriimonadaceae bacterium]